MFNLSKSEKQVILFLFGAAIFGMGISYFKNFVQREDFKIERIDISRTDQKPRSFNQKININSGSFDELCTLPQVGPAFARRIITHRNQYGPFRRIEDIKNVKGIGKTKYDAIKDFIDVE